jgi:hypothetical protein
MKLVGGLLIYLSLYALNAEVTLSAVLWLLLGILLIAPAEILNILMYTGKYIHRSKNSEQK